MQATAVARSVSPVAPISNPSLAPISDQPVALKSNEGGFPIPEFPWTGSIAVHLAEYERQLIEHALAYANGVKQTAAKHLRISRYALDRRLKRLQTLRAKATAVEAQTVM